MSMGVDFSERTKQRLRDTGENVVGALFERAKKLPFFKDKIAAEYEKMMADLRASAKPYRGEYPSYSSLPTEGHGREDLLTHMRELQEREASRWRDGYVSGAVYHGSREHTDFLEQAYAIHSQTNPLHSDLWPSITKYEAEIVAMTGHMLGAEQAGPGAEVCGTLSSGGTESILLAMKTYRDRARREQGNERPNIVAPNTAHAAFDKAAQYFGIELRKIPVGEDLRADVKAMKKALDRHTICLVGSAPAFPHGVIDPIPELAAIAFARKIGFHTDACLGGFVLPFARELGHAITEFDFRVQGVTSMSVDTHKYGYAAKGTSVVLYRDKELRRNQWFTLSDWPGGMYFSPTLSGSRPGGLSAACWAAMMAMGHAGYLESTRKILAAAATVRAGIESVAELELLGDPLWVLSFAARDPKALDIYRVSDLMSQKGWNLNGLHRPSCVHIALTLRHTEAGVAERFVEDLREATAEALRSPVGEGGMAPVYGMAATLPARGAIGDILGLYMDALYEV